MLVAVVCLVVRVLTLAWLLVVVVSWVEVSLQFQGHRVGVDVGEMMFCCLLLDPVVVRVPAVLGLVQRGVERGHGG